MFGYCEYFGELSLMAFPSQVRSANLRYFKQKTIVEKYFSKDEIKILTLHVSLNIVK
jgi:hypothetical protein